MNRETIEVELVTPCFLAGAAGQAEWRAASIRGQLRWWFRAVAGGLWEGDLERVRREEARLFGSTERGALLTVRALAGPGSATIQSLGTRRTAAQLAAMWSDNSEETSKRLKILRRDNGQEALSNPIEYLGYGAAGARPSFAAGGTASFELLWRSGPMSEEDRQVFEDALRAWLHLGGIGAKSRKGFGSLQRKEKAPASRDGLVREVSELLSRLRKFEREPAWTHFSAHSRIYLARNSARSWHEAMEWLGAWMIGFRRRYGYPGDTRTIDGVPLADRDYEWAAPGGRHLRQDVPDRAGFGLPLPFQRQNAGETVTWDQQGGEDGDKDARRASPLLLHVSRIGSLFVPVLTYLPARFLPDGGRFRFKKPPAKRFEPEEQQLGIIQRFLSDLENKHLIEQVTP